MLRYHHPRILSNFLSLKAYGNIYFKAWKEYNSSNISIINPIEEHILSHFFHASIHLQSSSTSKNLYHILKPFYDAKKNRDVDAMLHRMLSPILWRSLNAANHTVRKNACIVLGETFPLHNPLSDNNNAQQEEAQSVIDKSTEALGKLLKDEHPSVRIAALQSSAIILGRYWDAIPSEQIRLLLQIILQKCAYDKSSIAVRSHAITAAAAILESAPHSHAVLRQMLPKFLGKKIIHDRSETVRLSMCRMLHKVKKVRGIKYFHVVPVQDLLYRLQYEPYPHGSVAVSLTELICNSYFPQGETITGSEQVRRTLQFLVNNPGAAAVFYGNLIKCVSVRCVAKLAVLLLKCLSCSVVEATKQEEEEGPEKGGKKRRISSKFEEQGNDRESSNDTSNGNNSSSFDLVASNTSLMASIAETIGNLWQSVSLSTTILYKKCLTSYFYHRPDLVRIQRRTTRTNPNIFM